MKKSKKKMEEGGVVKKSGSDITSSISDMIVKILNDNLDQKMQSMISDADSRNNPSKTLKTVNNIDTGKSLISGAGKGASIGTMIAPGIGTAIGAGLGALTSGLGRLVGAGGRNDAITDATKEWSDTWSKKTGSALRQYGYKEGGKIKGEGTGKSDSIDMDAEDGSFIVPAENAEYAMELGREYLGWNGDETARKTGGSVDIKVSNGEVIFKPEEVSILKYHGIDVDALAPKAKATNEMKRGGNVTEEERQAKKEKRKEDFETYLSYAPELLGALQAAGGAYGLIKAGRKPDMQVSKTLQNLSAEVRKMSEYGYEPAVLNSLNAEIENTRRNISRTYTDSGGVSGLEKMAGLSNLLSTTIDKKAGLAFSDAAEKSRKYADVIRTDMAKAGQEFDINRMNVEDWYRNQEGFAGMLSSGIKNIIGARKLKSEQDNLRKIGNTDPTYNE